MNTLIQLPNDAVSIGYKQVGAFEFAQVFKSESTNFTGTEKEFLKSGNAYAYIQTSAHTRAVVIPAR